MLDKFDELTSWSRNAHRGGRINRSLWLFPLRRMAFDEEGNAPAVALLLCRADVFLNAMNYQIDFGIRKITEA